MLQPGSVLSKVSALALLALVALVVHGWILQPIVDGYNDNADSILRAHVRLQRYQALADQREALSERLADQRRDMSAGAGYIDAPSEALAAAAMQDLAAAMVTKVGGAIKSVELLAAEVVDGHPNVRRLGLRLRFAASITGLASVLHAIESGEPDLFVGPMTVSSSSGAFSASSRGDARDLDVVLDLVGYAQTAAPAIPSAQMTGRAM